MRRRSRRLARRFAALAPVLAALGGQALAAGSLRAPFLPHAGTTPAPLPSLATPNATAAGVAALRATLAAARRPDLDARLASLLSGGAGSAAPLPALPMSQSDDTHLPGSDPRLGASEIDATR
jgi:hypothetical protein